LQEADLQRPAAGIHREVDSPVLTGAQAVAVDLAAVQTEAGDEGDLRLSLLAMINS
jgi:hypothetical protein